MDGIGRVKAIRCYEWIFIFFVQQNDDEIFVVKVHDLKIHFICW